MRFVVALAFAAGAQASHSPVCEIESLYPLLAAGYFDAECVAALTAALSGVIPETSPCDCYLQVPQDVALTFDCRLDVSQVTLAVDYAVRPPTPRPVLGFPSPASFHPPLLKPSRPRLRIS